MRKHDENQAGNGQFNEKSQSRPQKAEHQVRGRMNNSFGQNQRGQSSHQQGGTQSDGAKGYRDAQGRSNGQSMKGQQERYYREKNRESDRDNHHKGSSGSRFVNIIKNRAEETIDDIKEDILRLEKEIELEIKEIRSLKL